MANSWTATWANYDVGSTMTAATEDLRFAARRDGHEGLARQTPVL